MDVFVCLYATICEMGSKEGLLFDLNDPTENQDDIDSVVCFQPLKAFPSKSIAKPDLSAASARPQGIVIDQAFSHSSPVHTLQPFAQTKTAQGSEESAQNRGSRGTYSSIPSSIRKINHVGVEASPDLQPGSVGAQDSEKEEGEWSDAEESGNACRSVIHDPSRASDKHVQERGQVALMENSTCPGRVESTILDTDNIKNRSTSSRAKDPEPTDNKSNRSKDGEKDSGSEPKTKVIRGSEANHALRSVNNIGKLPKPDQQKEVMLGKKRRRQTMFLDLQDVKQAGPLNTSTPRKQIPAPSKSWTVKETHPLLPSADSGEKQAQPVIPDIKQVDQLTNEGKGFVDSNDNKIESDEIETSHSGTPGPSGIKNSSTDLLSEVQAPIVSRQSSWKHPSNSKQVNQLSDRKTTVSNYSSTDSKFTAKRIPAKKQSFGNQYQDSSVERLLREVTSKKFWNHPGNLEFHVFFISIFKPSVSFPFSCDLFFLLV